MMVDGGGPEHGSGGATRTARLLLRRFIPPPCAGRRIVMRRFCLLLLMAACTPQPRTVVVQPWPELARTGAIRVSYDPASARLLQDGSYEVMVRQDHRARQIFHDTAYTQQDTRIRVRCGTPPVLITTVSDTLRNAGAVVSGHHYGATLWALVSTERSESGWALELCRRITAPGA
jgi:hypothetical protein